MTLMNWADYTILGIIGFSTIMSLARGFGREALSLIIWIAAFWAAFNFSGHLAELLTHYIHSPSLRMLASFGILFIITLLLGGLVNYLLSRLISMTGLRSTDRVIGVIFGGARGVLVVTVILLLARLTPMPEETWWHDSILIPYFEPLEVWLHGLLPASLLEHLSIRQPNF